jgi:hypothetical protein
MDPLFFELFFYSDENIKKSLLVLFYDKIRALYFQSYLVSLSARHLSHDSRFCAESPESVAWPVIRLLVENKLKVYQAVL